VHEKKKGLKEMSLYIIVDARAEEGRFQSWWVPTNLGPVKLSEINTLKCSFQDQFDISIATWATESIEMARLRVL